MTIYFTAVDDDAAAAALKNAPSGDETLTSDIAADGDAFNSLIELIWGKSLSDLETEQTEQQSVATTLTGGITRLGTSLVTAIAERDQGELADLAGPWAEAVGSAEAGDLVDFLNDLQHLCRHVKANGGSVYAVESY